MADLVLLFLEVCGEKSMGKFEKDMVRFIRIHKQCDKARLIQNMNKVMQEKGIKRRNKCRWIAEITGVPVGSVNTWFTTAKCRDKNRIFSFHEKGLVKNPHREYQTDYRKLEWDSPAEVAERGRRR